MNFLKKHPILANIGAMIVLSVLFIFLIIFATNLYTNHGKEAIVPQVKGMTSDAAQALINRADLRAEVVDSVYSQDVAPGSVVETVPAAGSKVKPGRIIFLTINALSPKQGTIPDINDQSSRQVHAVLNSIGFTNISEREVSGDFPGLTVGIETRDGKLIAPGTKLPLSTPLVLRVISGGMSYMPDSSAWLDPNSSRILDDTVVRKQNAEATNENWW